MTTNMDLAIDIALSNVGKVIRQLRDDLAEAEKQNAELIAENRKLRNENEDLTSKVELLEG